MAAPKDSAAAGVRHLHAVAVPEADLVVALRDDVHQAGKLSKCSVIFCRDSASMQPCP